MYGICILTSSNLEAFNDCFESCQKSGLDITVVINSLNQKYIESVREHIFKHAPAVLVVTTPSNGRPGKGHNSVLTTFMNLKYTHVILVDGDDKLFSSAPEKIRQHMEHHNLEVMCLAANTKWSHSTNHYVEIEGDGMISHVYECEHRFKEMEVDCWDSVFNTMLLTPFRLLCFTKSFVEKVGARIFDEEAYLFDDYRMFLELYTKRDQLNMHVVSDPHLYIYDMCNDSSLSHRNAAYEDENFRKKLLAEYGIENLDINLIKVHKLFDADHSRGDYERIVRPKRIEKRILVIHLVGAGYDFTNDKPMGGTEAAMWNLARALSEEPWTTVRFLADASAFGRVSDTLEVVNSFSLADEDWKATHIISSAAHHVLQGILRPERVLIFNQHDINVDFIKTGRDSISSYKDTCMRSFSHMFVSEWQRNWYVHEYSLPQTNTRVIQNAISPLLQCTSLQKTNSKVLIFCSAPYRGLIPCLKIFEKVRKSVPEAVLKVFSSMSRDFGKSTTSTTQNGSKSLTECTLIEHDNIYKEVYQSCIDSNGVEFFGSVTQPELFSHMQAATMLLYPCTFAETCCTSVLEAMACGLWVLTSDIGALPETCKGFAYHFGPSSVDFNLSVEEQMTSPIVDVTYEDMMAEKAVQLLLNPTESDTKRQTDAFQYMQKHVTWKNRAQAVTSTLCKIMLYYG